MKVKGEIAQKLKQARFRHVKRELEKHFAGQDGDWDKKEVSQVKAALKDFFETAPLHEIASKYPDVAALLWVLGDNEDVRKTGDLIPNGTLVGSMGGVMLWADSDDKAAKARGLLDNLAKAASESQSTATKGWWARWFR